MSYIYIYICPWKIAYLKNITTETTNKYSQSEHLENSQHNNLPCPLFVLSFTQFKTQPKAQSRRVPRSSKQCTALSDVRYNSNTKSGGDVKMIVSLIMQAVNKLTT